MTNQAMRIIKKYPNRRLYDTSLSRYVTLQDIKALVMELIDFKVVDARTEEDLTNLVLLQIIVEEEGSTTAPMFTREILQNIIRFYGDSMQSMMRNYLDQSMNLFVGQQSKFTQSLGPLFEKQPLQFFTELTERNLELWNSLQSSFVKKSSSDTTEDNGES